MSCFKFQSLQFQAKREDSWQRLLNYIKIHSIIIKLYRCYYISNSFDFFLKTLLELIYNLSDSQRKGICYFAYGQKLKHNYVYTRMQDPELNYQYKLEVD